MHTNGPWKISKYASGTKIKDANNEIVASIPRNHSNRTEISRLIAAAPELLQRLEDARNAIASLDEDALGYAPGDFDIGVNPWPLKDELLYRIDEAIRKAKGE